MLRYSVELPPNATLSATTLGLSALGLKLVVLHYTNHLIAAMLKLALPRFALVG
jgi:hypothetical protein